MEVYNDNPNRSCILDIINSIQGQFERDIHKNTVFYTGTYYNEDPESSDLHYIPETSLPQISISFPNISRIDRFTTMYSTKIKHIPSLSYKDLGRPRYFNFDFNVEFMAKSITEVSEMMERFWEWSEDNYNTLKTDSGFEYNFDTFNEFNGNNLSANFSDYKITNSGFRIGEVVMYGTKEKIGKLINTISYEVYVGGIEKPMKKIDNLKIIGE